MNPDELNYYYNRFKFGEDNFHNLMSLRIRKILLVATFYDAYIIEHDGRLTEQITGDYFRMNLTTVPRITSVPSGEEALELLKKERFDLIITTIRIGSPDPFELSMLIHTIQDDIPVLLLLTVKSDMDLVRQNADRMGHIQNVFLWNGDTRLFIAMIKTVEDRLNVAYDTEHGFVRVILLVEDSVDFYSRYLPMMYQEIMEQTQKLIREELNDNQKYHLMRTRPKILLVKSYEEALELSRLYAPYLLTLISDLCFFRNGVSDTEAGVDLIRHLKEEFEDVPMLLQSAEEDGEEKILDLDVNFIYKYSRNLMEELRSFIVNKLGFGDFVFLDRSGQEIGRASSLKAMEEAIHQIPIESILHHARHNHFSAWLVAHGEFQVARSLRPVKITDFASPEDHRVYLEKAFQEAREGRLRGRIVEFAPSAALSEETILRLREGSLGGKGRGLAFCNALLVSTELNRAVKGADIRIPRTLILGTDEFDQFLKDNRLIDRIQGKTDRAIQELFLECPLSRDTEERLEEYLELIHSPLAVRSSSLLEDSHAQPFAGVYETCLISNTGRDLKIRWNDLLSAVKLVYASVFREETRRFIISHGYRQDEEKMGIVIQELAGQVRGNLYYPNFSGVAHSFNYYPPFGLDHQDAYAGLAVGLGRTVVEGGKAFQYCPARPEIPWLTEKEQIRYSQTEFYALDLNRDSLSKDNPEMKDSVGRYPLSRAESDGMLDHAASVLYQGELEEGLFGRGPRIVNFPDIIRYNVFPLNSILNRIIKLFDIALGCPSEIEFAVDLGVKPLPVFYLLQVRPMTVSYSADSISPSDLRRKDAIVYTENSLGHGIRKDLCDFVYLPPSRFDKTCTIEMREEINGLNKMMKREQRKYILMAPGRWGSADRFLGIPVSWPQIDQAALIVEAAVKEMMVEPSQGSHFFHNLTAGGVGYLMVREGASSSELDWDTLDRLPAWRDGKYFRLIRKDTPFGVVLDGKRGIGAVYKSL